MAKNKQEPQVEVETPVVEEVVDTALQSLTAEELAKEELVEDLLEETETETSAEETETETPAEETETETPAEETETPAVEQKTKMVDLPTPAIEKPVHSKIMRAGFVF
jgi:hypothetical protein